MSIAFIQLSDIHFRTDRKNPVLDKAGSIAAAIRSVDLTVKHYFLLVNGDIAFSGLSEEYEIATEFINRLMMAIMALPQKPEVFDLYVPGNHDCDFRSGQLGRELLLEKVLAETKPGIPPSLDKINECLSAQNRFFEFVANRTSKTFPDANSCLFWKELFTVENHTVAVKCFNTSWLSRINEKKGTLIAPEWLVPQDYESSFDISLFHHPYSWFETNNARSFMKTVERTSDLILTGHEHDPYEYSKVPLEGNAMTYFEANVLQEESDPNASGFNLFLADLSSRKHKVISYKWKTDLYERIKETDWTDLARNSTDTGTHFRNKTDFIKWLHDPGAAFTHPRVPSLSLRDIYIYPDLNEWEIAGGRLRGKNVGRVFGADLATYLVSNGKVLMYGRENSGKTALAKVLYEDLQQLGKVPVYCSGEIFKSADFNYVNNAVERTFEKQYGSSIERFRQLDIEKKVVIIDGLQKARFNRSGWAQFVDALSRSYSAIAVFVRDSFQIEELKVARTAQSPFVTFKHCWIREFGHSLRYRTIEKWITLGQEYTISDSDKRKATKEIEGVMNVVLGRNLLPSYPIFVLTILQTHEAATTTESAAGAYGYHFELLIRQSLSSRPPDVTPDTLSTYLSYIAFEMLRKKRKALSAEQLKEVTKTYQAQYTVTFDQKEMLQMLNDALVLEHGEDNAYRFTYHYIYYFFAAKYIASNIHKERHAAELRPAVEYLAEHLHVEDYANILVFLVYLTQDEKLIESILDKAKSLYKEYSPCDYDKDVEFTETVLGHCQLNLALPETTDSEAADGYRQGMDSSSEQDIDLEEDQDEIEERELDDVLRINVAFKLMQIMGQMVRNTPGALPGDLKLELVQETYFLGLRVMQYVVFLVRDNLNDFRTYLAQRLKKELKLERPQDLIVKTDDMLSDWILLAGFAIIQRISTSVGSVHLEETYKQISESNRSIPLDLIRIAIRLDHYPTFPKSEVISTHRGLTKKIVPKTVLRWLVRDYFYKYQEDYHLRQSVCAQLDIKINQVGFIGLRDKKLLPSPKR